MSGISISVDSGTEFDATAAEYSSICRLDDNTYCVAYRDNGDGNKGKVNIGTRSGTTVTISEGTVTIFNNYTTDSITVCAMSATLIIISYRDVDSQRGYVIAGTVSGATITFGAAAMVANYALTYNGVRQVCVAELDATNFVVNIGYGASVNKAYVGSVSGNTITLGSEQSAADGTYQYALASVGLDSTHAAVIGWDNGVVHTRAMSIDKAAKTVTWGAFTELSNSSPNNGPFYITKCSAAHYIVAYSLGGNTNQNLRSCGVNLVNLVVIVGSAIQTASNGTDQSGFSLCANTDLTFIVGYFSTANNCIYLRSGTTDGGTILAWDAQGVVQMATGAGAYTSLCRMTDDYFISGYKSG